MFWYLNTILTIDKYQLHKMWMYIAQMHSDDILGARMLWKPKEARILKNFIDQPV
jgi:hypothetical protein